MQTNYKAQIFEPNQILKQKLGSSKMSNIITLEKALNAQEVLEQSKESFPEEALIELENAKDILHKLSDKDSFSIDKLEHFSRIILNIKSCSAMYGYDIASEIARSFYCFLSKNKIFMNEGKIRVAKIYLKSITTIFEKKIKGSTEDNTSSKKLLKNLKMLELH